MDRTVRIAGAGIAGMTAGINLAKSGLKVHISDVRSDVGLLYDHDFRFFENWTCDENVLDSLKRMHIDVDFPVVPIHEARAFDHKYRMYAIKCEEPIMYMVRRGNLDDSLECHLMRQALDHGVTFDFRTRMRRDDADIIATGPSSSKSLVFVRGAMFTTNLRSDIRVLFDPRISPKVYAYMVVHENDAIVCTAYTKEHHDGRMRSPHISSAIDAFRRTGDFEVKDVTYFGNFGVSPLVASHPKIVVGEAAGFQDVTWGFGMRLAVMSGYLAARSIIDRTDYWALVRQQISPIVASTTVNRFVLESFGPLAIVGFLKWLQQSGDARIVLKRFYKPHGVKTLLFKMIRSRMERRQSIRSGRA